MRQAFILLVCLLGLLAGCPLRDRQQQADDQQQPPDKLSRFGGLLRDQRGFADELKRLQRLYTGAPKPGYAPPGSQHSRFTLSSHVTPNGIALALSDDLTAEQWLLWAWRDYSDKPPEVVVVNDKPTTGGYLLEFNVAGQALAVSLTASWTQGRYLQVSRELLLGGLDHSIRVPEGYTDWVLDGPWLPYRMVPGPLGPYGVVNDDQANGSWQYANYPAESLAPALATYDKQRGFLLAVVDEHPRALDRDYQLAWRIAPDYSGGEQLKLGYRVYDNLQDAFDLAFLPSGLPLRDGIAIEPFDLQSASVDQTLVQVQTAEVIALTGQLIRAYHFAPNPPEPLAPGGLIDAAAWVKELAELPDFLRRSTGIWEAKYAAARFFDDTLLAGGNIGLGAAELPGGSGVASQAIEALALIDPQVLPVLARLDYLAVSDDDAYANAYPQWLAVDGAGQYFSADAAGTELLALDIRNPETAAWTVRKMSRDLAGYPQVGGYLFNSMFVPSGRPQAEAQGPFYISWPAAGAAICLRTAEEVRSARPDALLIGCPNLSLALPACCNGYRNGAASFPAPDLLPHANRLSNVALQELFGVSQIVAFSPDNLAAQVISTTAGVIGHELSRALENHAGFAAFAAHQQALRDSGGELAVIHSKPAQSAYALDGERPAQCRELIAVLPGDWKDAGAIWVAFYGSGGSIAVDTLNTITIAWDGGSWQGRLPGGYWEIEHPSPASILPGDAALVIRKPIGVSPAARDAAS